MPFFLVVWRPCFRFLAKPLHETTWYSCEHMALMTLNCTCIYMQKSNAMNCILGSCLLWWHFRVWLQKEKQKTEKSSSWFLIPEYFTHWYQNVHMSTCTWTIIKICFCYSANDIKLKSVAIRHLARDPSSRLLDGLFLIWTPCFQQF